MKKYLIIITAVIMALMLAACGSSGKKEQGASQESEQEQKTTTNEATEAAEATETTEEAVHPYAWQGLQDMPECNYLDTLCSNHYYRETEVYLDGLSYVSEEINAVDGINTYKKNENTLVYYIDGMSTSINEEKKYYIQIDTTDGAESSARLLEEAMKNGTNMSGLTFTEKGSGTIPVYSDQKDDKNEYEYYEYHNPTLETEGDSYIQRFYLKDGDVFAIYSKTDWGDTVIQSTEIIKKMTGDIPDGIFDLPDLSGFEKQEY
jgi:outer membrane murein-binding lipoprotein Lpp